MEPVGPYDTNLKDLTQLVIWAVQMARKKIWLHLKITLPPSNHCRHLFLRAFIHLLLLNHWTTWTQTSVTGDRHTLSPTPAGRLGLPWWENVEVRKSSFAIIESVTAEEEATQEQKKRQNGELTMTPLSCHFSKFPHSDTAPLSISEEWFESLETVYFLFKVKFEDSYHSYVCILKQ